MELNVNYDRAKMIKMEQDSKDERTSFRYFETFDPISAELTPDVYDVEILQAAVRRFPDKNETGGYLEQLELAVLFKSGADGIKNRWHKFSIWGARVHSDGHSDLNPVRLQDFLVLCSKANPKFNKHYDKSFNTKSGSETRTIYPEIAKLDFKVVASFSGTNKKGYETYFSEFFSDKGFSAVEIESASDVAQDIQLTLKKAKKVYAEAIGQTEPQGNAFGGAVQAEPKPKTEPKAEPQIKVADDDIPF